MYYYFFLILVIGLIMGYKLGYERGRRAYLHEEFDKVKKQQKRRDREVNIGLNQLKDVMDFLDGYIFTITDVRTESDRKEVKRYEELLMQNLLKLDGVENQNLREFRRTLVKEIQRLQNDLDRLTKKFE